MVLKTIMPLKESFHALLLLLTTIFILGSIAFSYEDFLMKHYDFPRSIVGSHYCNAMMQSQGMTKPKCRLVNTFIHDTKAYILDVCGRKGVSYGHELHHSIKIFSVTTCTLKGSNPRAPCVYKENILPQNIVIACLDGKPVHYEEGNFAVVHEDETSD
uniref:Ribonuclease A-domain domain-containing protein n=1 Tax=Pseudonaja textilis TaxID=8673 RepID=A0A670ZMV9_PSETE